MRKDPAAGGIVFQIVQNLVYLIELPFRELMYAQLVAVCLADAARSSAQLSQICEERSWMLLLFFCQIQRISSMADLR